MRGNLLLVVCLILLSIGCKQKAESISPIVFSQRKVVIRSDDTSRDASTLVLKNLGNRPVKVVDILSTCGCTVPQQDSQTIIPANGIFKIPLQIHYPKFGNKDVTVTVHVESTDGKCQWSTSVHVNVVKHLETPHLFRKPQQIYIEGVEPGSIASIEFQVSTVESSKERWLGAAITDDKKFAVKLKNVELEDYGESSLCHYNFVASAEVPQFSERRYVSSLEIVANGSVTANNPLLHINVPLVVELNSPVIPIPSMLILSDTKREATIIVSIRDENEWQVTSQGESTKFTVTHSGQQTSRKKSFVVTISEDSLDSETKWNEEIVFECTSERRLIPLTVPISYRE